MNRSIATATLAAAIGIGTLASAVGANAATPPGNEKCYGVNAIAKNDCAAGAHSCAGQATKARDPASFVYLPVGACGKIAGGKLTAA